MRELSEIDARRFGAGLRTKEEKANQSRASLSAHLLLFPRCKKGRITNATKLCKWYPVPPTFGIAVEQSPRLFLNSALGHKQTFAVQKRMSALLPKADMCGATWYVR